MIHTLLLLIAPVGPVRAQPDPAALRSMASDPATASAAFDHGPQRAPSTEASDAPASPPSGPAAAVPAPRMSLAAAVPSPAQNEPSSKRDTPWPIFVGLIVGLIAGAIGGFLAAGPLGAFLGAWFFGLVGTAIGLGFVKS